MWVCPTLPAIIRNSHRNVVVVSTRLGTVYRQIAEKATIIIAGVEMIPAFDYFETSEDTLRNYRNNASRALYFRTTF